MREKWEIWIDNVKGVACILVVLGHFFQSMRSAGVVGTTFVSTLFDNSIYYFHVPLFFICSGFLYQKYSRVENMTDWKNNSKKKLIALGVPYITFSLITWVMKVVFSGSVNNKADGIFTSLFLKPISPYWYLYALFFLFLINKTFKTKKDALVFVVISLGLKIVSFLPFDLGIYAVNTIFDNQIWFVAGMCLTFLKFPENFSIKKKLVCAGILWFAFITGSIVLCFFDISFEPIEFLFGIIGCVATILCVLIWDKYIYAEKTGKWCAKYTFPIFLMHTIFAAALRSVLFKLGIYMPIIHIIAGLIISFLGPVIAANIMFKFKWMNFFLYPNKYIKYKKEIRE